jgi:hypothetical protein
VTDERVRHLFVDGGSIYKRREYLVKEDIVPFLDGTGDDFL